MRLQFNLVLRRCAEETKFVYQADGLTCMYIWKRLVSERPIQAGEEGWNDRPSELEYERR